ncbi:hypothetical protein [Streptomyces sp. IBSBF 3352]|uniref:hypothetical protein n=1 Tax=Streptomyces sp. IBSBF 3352 TaxID=2903523 RepID=UPI002FDC253A
MEHALCSGDDEYAGHPTAARIAAFDVTEERERMALRAVVDYWRWSGRDATRAAAATTCSPPAMTPPRSGS